MSFSDLFNPLDFGTNNPLSWFIDNAENWWDIAGNFAGNIFNLLSDIGQTVESAVEPKQKGPFLNEIELFLYDKEFNGLKNVPRVPDFVAPSEPKTSEIGYGDANSYIGPNPPPGWISNGVVAPQWGVDYPTYYPPNSQFGQFLSQPWQFGPNGPYLPPALSDQPYEFAQATKVDPRSLFAFRRRRKKVNRRFGKSSRKTRV